MDSAAEEWRELTAEPRRYGFHATIKAPFRLRADLDLFDLMDAVAAVARSRSPFEAGELQIGSMKAGDNRAFVVLEPHGPSKDLHSLEGAAVRALDRLRAPLTEEERRRRNIERLTPRQRYYLEAWGYPYVIDEFRPHLTLTNAISDAERVVKALTWEYRLRVASPTWRVDGLALFGEKASDGEFELLRAFPLGRATRTRRRSSRAAAILD